MKAKRNPSPLSQAAKLLKEAMQTCRNEIKHQRAAIDRLQADRISLQLLCAVLFDRLKGLDTWTYISATSSRPIVNFSVSEADGFTDPRIVSALEFLTKEFEEAKTNESAEYLYRSYSFSKPEVQVCFMVNVKSDSPTCKRVEVGEEMVVQKKYKIVCEG